MSVYQPEFYRVAAAGSIAAAEAALGLATEWVQPRTVIDVGCGVGTWLSVLVRRGIDVTGVDGDYVQPSQLLIPADRFRPWDLEKPLPDLGQFDLAISVETAEHLSAERARSFVADLCRLAPVVVFSAAIPGQGGTQHVNEQWPEYWVKLFEEAGFVAIDCIRDRIWDRNDLPWWYAQNLFLAVRRDVLASRPELGALASQHPSPRTRVHPRNYLDKAGTAEVRSDVRNHSLRTVLSALPGMMLDFVRGQRGPKGVGQGR